MANKALKSLTFPDLSDTYTIPTKTSDLTNDSNFMESTGATMSGNLAMGSHKITGLANGTANTDAVNKKQMEDAIAASGGGLTVTEVTVSTAGSVTQALDAGKIYHFTGALTALTITLNTPASGVLAHYQFDFVSGSTAVTLTLPQSVVMPSDFAVEASKRYEVDILNNYGAVSAWATS